MEERRSEGSDPGNRTEPAPRSTTRTLASTVTRNGYVPLRQSFGKVGGTPQRLRSRWHVGEVALNDTVRRTSVQTTNCRALAQQMRRLRPTHSRGFGYGTLDGLRLDQVLRVRLLLTGWELRLTPGSGCQPKEDR